MREGKTAETDYESVLDQRLVLGVLPEQGGSISNWAKSGQASRFTEYYLKSYKSKFSQILFFSYENEFSSSFLTGSKIIPNGWRLHRWLYSFLLPLIEWKSFRSCHVLRVMHASGVIPAVLAKLIHRIPIVVTYGYHYFENARAEGNLVRALMFKWREWIAFALADRIIVTTERLREYVEKRISSQRVLHVPNGTDMSVFSPAISPSIPMVRRIIFVGRLVRVKNLKLLFDAAALLDEPVEIIIVGEGTLRNELSNYAQERGVSVRFVGVVENSRLPELLRTARIFVLTSFPAEGNPKSLVEAMACGLPSVGTDIPGIRELIRNGETGYLCKPQPESVAQGIRKILDHPERGIEMGRKAREFVTERFDIHKLLADETNGLVELALQSLRHKKLAVPESQT